MPKLSAKWVPKFRNMDEKWQRCQSSEQNVELIRRDLNEFLSRLVILKEACLFHNDPDTKQESMEWRHRSSPRRKNSECKYQLEMLWPRFFIIKTASFSLIIFQRAKLPTWSITHLCWWNWLTFWKKTLREFHQGNLVLARQSPASPGTCNPDETGLPDLPFSRSPTLFSGPDPVGLPPVLWTEKKRLKIRYFSSEVEVIFAAET